MRIALGGTRFDLCFGLPDRRQAFFAPCEFLRDAQALGQGFLIGGLGTREPLGKLGLQPRFDLLGMPMGARAVTRGIGVDLGAIQGDRVQLEPLHLPGDTQHLDEQRLDLLEKALADSAKRVVVRVRVHSDVTKGNRLISRRLETPPVA